MVSRSAFPDGLLDSAVEVGAVTDRSVRAWVRKPDTPTLNGELQLEDGAQVLSHATLSTESDWTGALVFELSEPAPGARYRLEAAGQVREGRLAPSPGSSANFTFAFASCNQPFADLGDHAGYHSVSGIYDRLFEDLERAGAAFFMLVGDQIYSDEIDPVSVRSYFENDTDPPPLDLALEAYRDISRGYFNVPGFRRLRERFPTYCIWDDHDIFDNWGSRQVVSPLDQRLFDAADHAYREYQHPRNPVDRDGPPYHYTFEYGDAGFLVLDVRGARDWQSGQLLGEAQWRDISAYLQGEAAANLSTLFVVTSIPVAQVSRWIARIFERIPGRMADSVRDRWCAAAFQDQRDELLRALFAWQRAEPARQVIILSGDVHVAAAFTIRERHGPGVIQQFTSSAMTTPLTSFERYMNMVAARWSNLLEPEWRFQRHFLRYENNAGLVRLTPLPTGGHHTELLIRGWQPFNQNLRTVARLSTRPS